MHDFADQHLQLRSAKQVFQPVEEGDAQKTSDPEAQEPQDDEDWAVKRDVAHGTKMYKMGQRAQRT